MSFTWAEIKAKGYVKGKDGNWYRPDKGSPDALAGRVCAKKPERDKRGEGQDRGVEAGQGRSGYCIVFTVYRKNLLDSGDNELYALKPVKDKIAWALGFCNDNHPLLSWHYHQVQCDRDEGTSVRIERL